MNNHNPGTNLIRAEVAGIVIASLQEVLTLASREAPAGVIGEETCLIGQGAVLDSLGLVNLILEVEQRLEADHSVTIILADERAMSQKNSPFRSVRSLTDYVCRLVEEQGARVGG